MTLIDVPPGVPLVDAQRRSSPGYGVPALFNDGVAAATSVRARATATASATPHTLGAWTQIIAATTNAANVIHISLTAATATSGADTSTLLSVSTGTAGNEATSIIIPNLAIGYAGDFRSPIYQIPVNVPAGSRLSIACQSVVASKTVAVQLGLGLLPDRRVAPVSIVALGADTANSRGVVLGTPGGANTKGAWTQIIAATTEPFDALVVGMQGGGATGLSNASGLVDIGFGSAGNEVILAGDLPVSITANEIMSWWLSVPLIPCRLPAGTRLAARYQQSAGAPSMDLALYGVRP